MDRYNPITFVYSEVFKTLAIRGPQLCIYSIFLGENLLYYFSMSVTSMMAVQAFVTIFCNIRRASEGGYRSYFVPILKLLSLPTTKSQATTPSQ